MKSVYFDELSVGDAFQTALSRPISEQAIESYFELTNDRFNVHRDPAFAKKMGLPDVMVPGNLVVAIATGLVYEHGHFSESLFVQAKKSNRFVSPLFVGECIYVVDKIVGVQDRPDKRY